MTEREICFWKTLVEEEGSTSAVGMKNNGADCFDCSGTPEAAQQLKCTHFDPFEEEEVLETIA